MGKSFPNTSPLATPFCTAFPRDLGKWGGLFQNFIFSKIASPYPYLQASDFFRIIWKFAPFALSLQQKSINSYCMSKKEKEEKIKEFWEYYESTQGSITIADPIVLD